MFNRLGAIARHLGRKAVTFGEGALGKLHHIGSKIHEAAGKIPVIGGAVQGAMSAAYNTRIPFVGVSAKDAFEGAKKTVSVGKSVTSEDPDERKRGYDRVLQGDLGSTAQMGARAIHRIAGAIT